MSGRPAMAVPHVRVRGFCDACQGLGRQGVQHIDVELTAGERALADLLHIRRDTLRLVANAVRLQVEARLAEVQGDGCEAAAARMFQLGRLEVIDTDMWRAVGISKNEPDLTPHMVEGGLMDSGY